MLLPLHVKIESFSVLLMKKFYKPNILEILGVPKESVFIEEINAFLLKQKKMNLKKDNFKDKINKSMSLSLVLNKITGLVANEENTKAFQNL
jgi:hypothetical protein